MDSIQRLRYEAAAAGTLWSNAQQRVTTERQGIVIEPANPGFIYPPVYSRLSMACGRLRTTRLSIFLRPIMAWVSRCLSASGSVWGLSSSNRYGAGAPSIGASVGFNSTSTGLTPSIAIGPE
jgi:Protein of unknown function (DUF3300)